MKNDKLWRLVGWNGSLPEGSLNRFVFCPEDTKKLFCGSNFEILMN
jgi:hypothetical protein